ncbi:MAG: CRISPR-associated endonuclease Cas1 [Rhodoferax sp.]|nr:CRISPR-associated endonuclease Cas1 [Rhodoferax sp.]
MTPHIRATLQNYAGRHHPTRQPWTPCAAAHEGTRPPRLLEPWPPSCPALQFNGRNRRPRATPVNACLSLGYTLLHAEAVQACAVTGLDPLLGFTTARLWPRKRSDLIEALRPFVDLWVWELVRSRTC